MGCEVAWSPMSEKHLVTCWWWGTVSSSCAASWGARDVWLTVSHVDETRTRSADISSQHTYPAENQEHPLKIMNYPTVNHELHRWKPWTPAENNDLPCWDIWITCWKPGTRLMKTVNYFAENHKNTSETYELRFWKQQICWKPQITLLKLRMTAEMKAILPY